MDGESSFMLMETFTRDIGMKIWLMEKGNTYTQMGLSTMVIGTKINNMELGQSLGLMVQNTKVNLIMD